MAQEKEDINRLRAAQEMEEAIIVCLLQNGYKAREAEKLADSLIKYFYELEAKKGITDK